jgi:hypothetical protein
MVDVTVPQHGDLPDAALWAFLAGAPPTSQILTGLAFDTVDYAVPEVTVAGGKAIVDRGAMTTAHPNIDPPETYEDSVAAVQIDSLTVGLDDGVLNHIFLDGNVANDDSGTIVANTSGDLPSTAAFKIGEVDTGADSASEQWRLVADDGTLTFPTEAAIDAEDAAGRLREGTDVYDRAENAKYVITA